MLNILTSNLKVSSDFANIKKMKIGPLTTWLGKDVLKITWSINLRDQQDFKICKFFFLLKSKYENWLVKAGINKNYVTWKIVVLFLRKWTINVSKQAFHGRFMVNDGIFFKFFQDRVTVQIPRAKTTVIRAFKGFHLFHYRKIIRCPINTIIKNLSTHLLFQEKV